MITDERITSGWLSVTVDYLLNEIIIETCKQMFCLYYCRILVYNVNISILNGDKDMEHFNARKLIKILIESSPEDKKKKAYTSLEIKEEIKKICNDTKISLYHQTREDAIKYALWQGLLNQYGIFGTKRNLHKNSLYDLNFKHGDLISIDFGTSNVGKEFSYTHTAIVLKSYTDFIVVIPTTSYKEGRLEHKPKDEQDDTLNLTPEYFKDLESESYIMLYQIRSVSKNRIQKKIGSIADTELMKTIDYRILKFFAEKANSDFEFLKESYSILEMKNKKLENENKLMEKHIKELENRLKYINKSDDRG